MEKSIGNIMINFFFLILVFFFFAAVINFFLGNATNSIACSFIGFLSYKLLSRVSNNVKKKEDESS